MRFLLALVTLISITLLIVPVAQSNQELLKCENIQNPAIEVQGASWIHSKYFCDGLTIIYPLTLPGTKLKSKPPKFESRTKNGLAVSAMIDTSYSSPENNRGVAFVCLTESAMRESRVLIEYSDANAIPESLSCKNKIVEIDDLAERFKQLKPSSRAPTPHECEKFETLPPVTFKATGLETDECVPLFLTYPAMIEDTDLLLDMPPDLIIHSEDNYAVAFAMETQRPKVLSKDNRGAPTYDKNEVSVSLCLSKRALSESTISVKYMDWVPPEDAYGCEKMLMFEHLDKMLTSGGE